MRTLVAIGFVLFAFFASVGVAFADDATIDGTPVATVAPERIQEIDSTTDVIDQPINSTGDLDNQSPYEAWQSLAAALPFIGGFLLKMMKVPKDHEKTRHGVMLGTFFVFTLIGEFLKGTFGALDYYSPQAIYISLVQNLPVFLAVYATATRLAPSWVNAERPTSTLT